MYGTSSSERSSVSGTENTASPPNTLRETTVAATVETMTGTKPTTVYSINTTSIAKTTPASGVLKDAAIAAALPQATSVRRFCAD